MGGSDGVEIRPGSIRLFFVDGDGRRQRETLKINGTPMKPTAANILHARRTAAEIRKRVALGTFVMQEFFPHAKSAQAIAPATPESFGVLADNWLAAQGEISAATRGQYRNAIGIWKGLLGEATPIDALPHHVLAAKIGEYPWASAKLLNNYLIPLRGVFAMQFRGRDSFDSPMIGIENRRVVKKLPDPLTAGERDRILADMDEHYDPRIAAYFRFAFFTGMRPEEQIALRWGDIDGNARVARVRRVRTFKGSERDGSKTHAERDVDLVAAAMDALRVMRPFTQMLGRDDGEDGDADIFQNPVTGRPWHDERSQRDHYWKPSLKRLKIRARGAYKTRHTYATAALMGNVRPGYIALQLGHSVKMLLEKYARWIPGNDDGVERRVLEESMRASSPQVPQRLQSDHPSQEKDGRRDWTRTNSARKT